LLSNPSKTDPAVFLLQDLDARNGAVELEAKSPSGNPLIGVISLSGRNIYGAIPLMERNMWACIRVETRATDIVGYVSGRKETCDRVSPSPDPVRPFDLCQPMVLLRPGTTVSVRKVGQVKPE